jgi:hypothetical protein
MISTSIIWRPNNMAKTEQELKEARKARRVIQRAAKKAGMSTKEYRAKLAAETAEPEETVAPEVEETEEALEATA